MLGSSGPLQEVCAGWTLTCQCFLSPRGAITPIFPTRFLPKGQGGAYRGRGLDLRCTEHLCRSRLKPWRHPLSIGAATAEATARKTSSRLVEGLEFQAAGLLSVTFRLEIRSFEVSGSLRIYRGLSLDEAFGANTDKSQVSGESRERECNAGRVTEMPVNCKPRNTVKDVQVTVHQMLFDVKALSSTRAAPSKSL